MQRTPLPASPRNCVEGSRRHPRTLFSVPVMLQHLVSGGVGFTRGISLDISESGLGALLKRGLRVGETVSLELGLPDYDLKAAAIVRHSSSARSGFEFLGLTDQERRRISGLVANA